MDKERIIEIFHNYGSKRGAEKVLSEFIRPLQAELEDKNSSLKQLGVACDYWQEQASERLNRINKAYKDLKEDA